MRSPAIKILVACLMILAGAASTAAAGEVYGTMTDPGYIGVGARPLGMGKAYVALAEDGNSIFTNPAGLGRINKILVGTMYSNLMEDVNYTVGSLTLPVGTGTLAFGYLGSSVPNIDLYSITDEGTIESLGTANYTNFVLYLSYGLRLEAVNPDVMVGANLKSFGKTFTGPQELLGDGNGTGINLDVGVLYQPSDWLTLGFTQQNVLDSGKMQFESGLQEDIPGLTKLGLNMNLFGKHGFMIAPYKVNLATDVDFDMKGEKNSTLHMGAEIWPVEMLAVRLGVDQDPTPDGVMSNLTSGVGVRIGDISFDYAYHTYFDVPENATNFFSISMVGPFEQRKARRSFEAKLEEPKDNLITYDGKVALRGVIADARPGDRVEVNEKPITVGEDGTFKANLTIERLGAKRIRVICTDDKGERLSFRRTVFKLASFKDVDKNHWAKRSIELLSTAGLVSGYPDGRFRPEKTLSRAELATLLVKAKNVPLHERARGLFPDVPKDYWAAVYIEAASEAGLIKGYTDKTFRPNKTISKAEGVVVMVRLEGLEDMAKDMREDVEDSRFFDIRNNWAAGYIMAADDAGMLEYMGESTKFNPNSGFTRAEAVEMLSKTTIGQEKIRAMLEQPEGGPVVGGQK